MKRLANIQRTAGIATATAISVGISLGIACAEHKLIPSIILAFFGITMVIIDTFRAREETVSDRIAVFGVFLKYAKGDITLVDAFKEIETDDPREPNR